MRQKVPAYVHRLLCQTNAIEDLIRRALTTEHAHTLEHLGLLQLNSQSCICLLPRTELRTHHLHVHRHSPILLYEGLGEEAHEDIIFFLVFV